LNDITSVVNSTFL